MMCQYYKKRHTCDHESDRPYVEWCRDGIIGHAICHDISEDLERRRSHFPCYPCIKQMAREEIEQKAKAEQDAAAKAEQDRLQEVKAKQLAERKVNEDKIRREAALKAAREREEELRIKKEKDELERQAKKEGGAWIESGSKKGKNKKIGTGSPGTAFQGFTMDKKTTASKTVSPKKDQQLHISGRAGVWGPKKILSRKENDSPGASVSTSDAMKR